MIEDCCGAAAHLATGAAEIPYCRVVNEVVLNQVLLRVEPPGIDDLTALHEQIADTVRRGGICWIGTTRWRNQPALRISVSNWSTTIADMDLTVRALREAVTRSLSYHQGVRHEPPHGNELSETTGTIS